MFTWPALELTEYEKKFVGVYRNGKKPGVLRRTYEVFLNSLADPLTPGLEQVKLSGQVQISRRTRVFGLSYSGNLGSWRLQIMTASGEQFTPKLPQADGFPVVSSMIAGSMLNGLSAFGDQMVVFNGMQTPDGEPIVSFFGSKTQGPLLIDPNWELSPNETLIFNGTPIPNQTSEEFPKATAAQKLLSIAVHVWEFPNMSGKTARMGAGPQIADEEC